MDTSHQCSYSFHLRKKYQYHRQQIRSLIECSLRHHNLDRNHLQLKLYSFECTHHRDRLRSTLLRHLCYSFVCNLSQHKFYRRNHHH